MSINELRAAIKKRFLYTASVVPTVDLDPCIKNINMATWSGNPNLDSKSLDVPACDTSILNFKVDLTQSFKQFSCSESLKMYQEVDYLKILREIGVVGSQGTSLFPDSALEELSLGQASACKYALSRGMSNPQVQKHVVLVTHDLEIGGAQISLLELAAGLRRKYKLTLLTPKNGPLGIYFRMLEIQVVHFTSLESLGLTFGSWAHWIGMQARFILNFNPDAVLANTVLNMSTAIASSVAGIPSILISRESEKLDFYLKNIPLTARYYYHKINEIVDCNIFVSDVTRKACLPKQSTNFLVINNSLLLGSSSSFRPLSSSNKMKLKLKHGVSAGFTFLSVGVFSERKNQIELIKSFQKVVLSGVDCARLILVGLDDATYSYKIKLYVERLPEQVKSKIIIFEKFSSVYSDFLIELYQIADVFVLTSKFESYPRVVLEAQCFHLPVISTRCFGTLEQVEDGLTGFLYDCGDSLSLAVLMKKIMKDQVICTLRKNVESKLFTRDTFEDMLKKYFICIDNSMNS